MRLQIGPAPLFILALVSSRALVYIVEGAVSWQAALLAAMLPAAIILLRPSFGREMLRLWLALAGIMAILEMWVGGMHSWPRMSVASLMCILPLADALLLRNRMRKQATLP
jgi:hypothetical protein